MHATRYIALVYRRPFIFVCSRNETYFFDSFSFFWPGAAVQSWVIDGFPAGTGFVERIVCSRNETNPAFTISKTPGDGDCLFYSMIDVATEILQVSSRVCVCVCVCVCVECVKG